MRRLAFALAAAPACGGRMVALPNGKTITISTEPGKVDFRVVKHTPIPHPRYTDLAETTYKSPAVKLMTGEAWFTLPDVTKMPMPSPGKPYALINVAFDFVDGAGKQVPLSEVYMHHWLLYDRLVGSTGIDMGCGGTDSWVSNIFGAGSEMRGIDYRWPEGYGYLQTRPDTHWSANLHFIRVEDLSTDYFNGSHDLALKSCEECGYAPGKGVSCNVPDMKAVPGVATLACCFDTTRCPVNNPSDKSKKEYFISYKVQWTTEVEKVIPVILYVQDMFHCEIFGNLRPNIKNAISAPGTTCDDKLCITTFKRTFHTAGTIVWAYDHMHNGGVNHTMYINGVAKCTSTPRYGTDPKNTPGNELGHVVGFELCVKPMEPATHVHVNKGDEISGRSIYNVDESDPNVRRGGSHLGTMNLFYFFFVADGAGPGPAPAGDEYACVGDVCSRSPGGGPLVNCEAMCGGPPPPAPAQMYMCIDGACTAAAGGLDLKTCQAAC